ncbi:MAG: SDR family oxidoreductase [Clostridioides sp.]|jgi:NAD(P)-dependent dehydrogenase (short-subunit alcohol dehydrogenase family)|nr:SDR family oxidoreductase [Clostridioides sp.]
MESRKAIKDRFAGRVAIVTGGSSGIGKSILEELCKEGAKVVFSGTKPVGFEIAEELKAQGYEAIYCQGDMIEEDFCQKVVDTAVENFGHIDHLVNNAFSFNRKAFDAKTEDWQRAFFVGPVGYVRMIQKCLPYFPETGGSIVNMSSISAHIAQIQSWTYNAAKGAVDQITKNVALDLGSRKIRVNSISPAWIWSREVHKAADLDGGGKEKWDPIWGQYHMLERCGECVEVAGPVLFLLSDDASFITGTDLPIDGGYLAMGPEGLGKTASFAGSN